jgi:hypothetical protein
MKKSEVKTRKGCVQIDRHTVRQFKQAVAVSGLPLRRIAKKHFDVTSQTLYNIVAGGATQTRKRTYKDMKTFIEAFTGVKIEEDTTPPIKIEARDTAVPMTEQEHKEAHGMTTRISSKVFGFDDVLEIVKNIAEITNSNLSPEVKLKVVKTLTDSVC